MRRLLTGAWQLDPGVALRRERFGALAYHYGNRRLTFLRSARLVELVGALGSHPSVDEALAASAIPPGQWPAYREALATLASRGVLQPRS